MNIKFTASVFFIFTLVFCFTGSSAAADRANINELQADRHKSMLDKYKQSAESLIRTELPWACMMYLYDRSVTCAHEFSHAAISKFTGNETRIHISPWPLGGGFVQSSCPPNTLNGVLFCLSGPLAGVTMSFLWFPIWCIAEEYFNAVDTKKPALKPGSQTFFNEHSSYHAILHTFLFGCKEFFNFVPYYHACNSTYSSLSGERLPSDGLRIQMALTTIAPALAKIYPYLSCAGYVGLLGYGIYGLYATYKAKKQAGQKI